MILKLTTLLTLTAGLSLPQAQPIPECAGGGDRLKDYTLGYREGQAKAYDLAAKLLQATLYQPKRSKFTSAYPNAAIRALMFEFEALAIEARQAKAQLELIAPEPPKAASEPKQ